MTFFKRLLQKPEVEPPPQPERRKSQRFRVHPEFHLRTVLSFVGRDDTGAPMGASRHNWHWKGHVIDVSEEGARMQMGPGVKGKVGDNCDLLLTIEDVELNVPCRVANISEGEEGTVFGLEHTIDDAATWSGYRQLLEVVALGSTLVPQGGGTEPDESGYLLEVYASDLGSRLSIWRDRADRSVVAFEFVLKDSIVRAAAGQAAEYLYGTDGASAAPADPVKEGELRRLFQWVVPNLPAETPSEVRTFLLQYAKVM